MKKLLLTSMIILSAVSAHAGDIKPVLGIDYTYSDIGLKNGWEYVAEDKYNSFNLSAGFKSGKYVGMEAFFQHSGKKDGAYTIYGPIQTSFYAIGSDVIGYLPIQEKLNLLGSIGFGYYNVTAELAGYEESENGLGIRLGAGVQYDLTNNIALRSIARYVKPVGFDTMDDIMEISTGIHFSF